MHLRSDDLAQPLIPRQPEHKVHTIVFAPTHQLVTTEAGVSTQNDFHFPPGCPDLRYDSSDFLKAAKRAGVVCFSRPREQNTLSAENVQRPRTRTVAISV